MEEFRKDEEMLSARKAERDHELDTLKTFQSQQIDELRSRESEAERLHRTESELNDCIEQLRTELSKLDAHVYAHTERIQVSNDMRRIKIQLKNLSEAVLRDLYYGNELLERLAAHHQTDKQQLQRARDRFDEQVEAEVQLQRQIESMYESEANSFAMQQQNVWLTECKTRENVLRELITNQVQHLSNEADYVRRRQREFLEVRDCHRRAIDSSNYRIESLLGANTADESQRFKSAEGIRSAITPASNDSMESNRHLADEICLPDLFSRAANVADGAATPVSSGRPQFGRKRVVWT